MIEYKVDIMSALRDAGYTPSVIRQTGIFSESTLQAFRKGKMVRLDQVNRLCAILGCQPGDLLTYTPAPDDLKTPPRRIAVWDGSKWAIINEEPPEP